MAASSILVPVSSSRDFVYAPGCQWSWGLAGQDIVLAAKTDLEFF